MKKLIFVILMGCSTLAFAQDSVRVYPRINGYSVDQLCFDQAGLLKATEQTCQSYSVDEAGPHCYGASLQTVTVSRVQTFCAEISNPEDNTCLRTYKVLAPLSYSVPVVESESQNGEDLGRQRVFGYVNYSIPTCMEPTGR